MKRTAEYRKRAGYEVTENKTLPQKILTMDFETDPFEYGKVVKPFACGLYDGENFDSVWSSKCADKMLQRLEKLPPSTIYMHNGGRFDIYFILQSLSASMLIINGRIVKATLGKHEVRDSFSILPVALKAYKKDDIDINKLHRTQRQKNKKEILSYLRGDCVYLHELVTAFIAEFGDKITIGSAAMEQLKKFHPFQNLTVHNDEKFRTQFYRGGRVQVFQSGVLNKKFKIYDVNSMYPDVMKNFKHPNVKGFDVDKVITDNTAFIIAEGHNYGAFAVRDEKGGLDFTRETGRFNCTIHEWDAALDTGMFKPSKVIRTYQADDWISFGDFVDHFFAGKVKAKADGDKIHELFYKLILNSAYGKFAQNPEHFRSYEITNGDSPGDGWEAKYSHNGGTWIVWEKNNRQGINKFGFYNVAIGASITGAARSVLMRGLHSAVDLMYCDTDSIICRELGSHIDGFRLSDTELGAWKLEAKGDRIAIAGKKTYACFDGDVCVKKATKGVRCTAEEIVRIAEGEVLTIRKDAPTFKLNGDVKFIERRIGRTV